MKKKIRVQTSLVDRLISEGVAKTMEKSGSSFKTVENVVEVGTICLDKKEFILFSADKDDRAIGANYRIGEKEGSEYKTRPVMIDLVNNTIKITKDEGSWTQEMKIKKIAIDNTDVPEIPVEQNITEGKERAQGREFAKEEKTVVQWLDEQLISTIFESDGIGMKLIDKFGVTDDLANQCKMLGLTRFAEELDDRILNYDEES